MCFDFFFLIRIDQLPVILQNTFTDFKVLMSTFNSTFLRQIFLHNLFSDYYLTLIHGLHDP